MISFDKNLHDILFGRLPSMETNLFLWRILDVVTGDDEKILVNVSLVWFRTCNMKVRPSDSAGAVLPMILLIPIAILVSCP